jgi:hypothetical protein
VSHEARFQRPECLPAKEPPRSIKNPQPDPELWKKEKQINPLFVALVSPAASHPPTDQVQGIFRTYDALKIPDVKKNFNMKLIRIRTHPVVKHCVHIRPKFRQVVHDLLFLELIFQVVKRRRKTQASAHPAPRRAIFQCFMEGVRM